MDDIAKRLEEVRVARGWSAREFSLKAGLSAGQLQKLKERGAAHAQSDTLAALARAGGVTLTWLLTGSDAPGAEHADTPAPHDEPQAAPDVALHDSPPATMGQLEGYASTERAARKLAPDLEEWTWQYLRVSNPLLDKRYPITPASLETLARAIAKHAQPPANQKK